MRRRQWDTTLYELAEKQAGYFTAAHAREAGLHQVRLLQLHRRGDVERVTRGVYANGVFEPLEEVKGARPDQRYTAFADDELAKIRETLGWLKGAEKSFEFWSNATDAIYDET